jgi:hypothetical protein
MAWVRERTIPTERSLVAGEVSDNFCHVVSVTDPYGSILGFLYRSRYVFFQVALQLYSRGWVDAVPDPLLFRKFGSARNRTRKRRLLNTTAQNAKCGPTFLHDPSLKSKAYFLISPEIKPKAYRVSLRLERYVDWICCLLLLFYSVARGQGYANHYLLPDTRFLMAVCCLCQKWTFQTLRLLCLQ